MGKGKTWIGNELDEAMLKKLRALNELAAERGQKLSQMALSWVLRGGKVTTVLVGASRPEQLAENAEAVKNLDFSPDELDRIEKILKS